MFWICAGNNVDNTEMFSLLLKQSQGLFSVSPHPISKAGDAQEAVRRYS